MKLLANVKISNLLKAGKVFVQTVAGKAVVAGVAVVLIGGAVTIGVVSHRPASVPASTKNSIASSTVSASSLLSVEVKTITLDKTNTEVTVQNKVKLNAAINPADATNTVLTWTSSDNSIATVGSDGTVTGVFAGTVTITAAADNGVKVTCQVTVSAVTSSSSSDVLKEGGQPVSSTASKSSSASRNTSSATVSHKAPSKSSTAPAAPVPATQPAGTSGFAFNETLSISFNKMANENRNTAFFSTLYNDTLNAIKNHKGAITKQDDMNNEISQLTNKYCSMMDRNTLSEYTHNSAGYTVENCWCTIAAINFGDARALYNTTKSQSFFSQIQGLGSYFIDVPSERFAYTYVFYDPSTQTNKLIRFVWYVSPAATRVS